MSTESAGKLARHARQFAWAYQLGISAFATLLRRTIRSLGWALLLGLVIASVLLVLYFWFHMRISFSAPVPLLID